MYIDMYIHMCVFVCVEQMTPAKHAPHQIQIHICGSCVHLHMYVYTMIPCVHLHMYVYTMIPGTYTSTYTLFNTS